MCFSNLSRKMLLANIRSYFIFIGGNLLAVSLFFAFVSLYTNRSFMNETIVDPMISSNILFAGYIIFCSNDFYIGTGILERTEKGICSDDCAWHEYKKGCKRYSL